MIDPDSFEFTEEIIRDGSYASDFKFDPHNLRELLRILDDLSFVDKIDVGPGTGLGTERPVPEPSSEEHLRIAAETVSDTKLTALMLPSVAGESEIELIDSYADALDLIRVGVDADDASRATELLTACDDLGVPISFNLLKTYLVSPAEAVDAAEMATKFGAEVVYVVDSAGSFVPSDVTEYVTALADIDAEIGFHGHNNLGWGLQNALAAVESGATHLDASFQGIGRSAGNVQTELLCASYDNGLPREDWHLMFELEALLDEIYPSSEGVAIEDVLYGLTQFHSSYEPDLRAFAEEQDESFVDLLLFAVENELGTIEQIRDGYRSLQQ